MGVCGERKPNVMAEIEHADRVVVALTPHALHRGSLICRVAAKRPYYSTRNERAFDIIG